MMSRLRYRTVRFAWLILLGALLLGFTSCGSPARSDAPEESQPVVKSGGFPEDDIPIYDGLARDYVSDDGPLLVVNGTTDDAIEKVMAFYRERMPGKGWKEGVDPTAGGGSESLYYEKGTAKVTILVSTDDGKTRVSVQVEGYVAH